MTYISKCDCENDVRFVDDDEHNHETLSEIKQCSAKASRKEEQRHTSSQLRSDGDCEWCKNGVQ